MTRLARRLFAAHESQFNSGPQGASDADPFNASGPFFRFAKKQGLVKGVVAPAKTTWQEFDTQDRRVNAVHRLLRWGLRILGPHRYELLMRYLAHISVLRHQGVFLREARWQKAPGSGEGQ